MWWKDNTLARALTFDTKLKMRSIKVSHLNSSGDKEIK